MLGFGALGQFALGQASAGQIYAVSVAEVMSVADTQSVDVLLSASIFESFSILDSQDASIIAAPLFTVSGPGVEAVFPNGGISIPSEDVSFPYHVVQRTA